MPYGSLNGSNQLGAGWGMPTYNQQPQLMDPTLGLVPTPELAEVTSGAPTWHGGYLDGMLGTTKTGPNGVTTQTQGWGMPALGVASGAFNAWLGMKQYGLAKKQLAEGQKQFGLNYDAQRTTTNAQLEDRQRARVASNASAYQSVGDYMGANGIRPRG
jgi:hypothetical protein